MTVMLNSAAFRPVGLELTLGTQVSKSATTLVQNASQSLFTITGGRVLVRGIVGSVTSAIANTASLTVLLQTTPSGGSAANLCAATAATNLAAGTMISVSSSTITDAATTSVSKVNLLSGGGFVLRAGTITQLVSDHDPGTGAISWELLYVPLDDAAAVTSA